MGRNITLANTLRAAGLAAVGAVFAASLVAIAVPNAAEAQRYRDDVPNVLPKPAKEKRYRRDDQRHLDDFAVNYRNQKSPRIAVFWNRRLTDRLTQWASNNRTINTAPIKFTQREGRKRSQSQTLHPGITEKQRRISDIRRQRLKEEVLFQFESGFMEPFLNAGARMIDRAAIMRLTQTAAHRKGKTMERRITPDSQYVEVSSLTNYADVFAEVLYTPSKNSETGIRFQVQIKEVRTGRILTMVRSTGKARDPNDPKNRNRDNKYVDDDDEEEDENAFKYVAGKDGFKRVRRKKRQLTPDELGRNLAVDTMMALNRVWSRLN